MAKQKKFTPKPQQTKIADEGARNTSAGSAQISWQNSRFLPYGIIAVFTFLIYANTLWNSYAIDDTMVITDNKFTKKGVAGIPEIFTNDAFVGFFGEVGSKLVAGGRYRPLSIATFAVEYEISRKWKGDTRTEITNKNVILGEDDAFLSPAFSHFNNILLFIIVCFLLYAILARILPKKEEPFYFSLAFLATMIFAAHPIHTEAVTNIKGRDEVMGLLFALATLQCSLLFVEKKKVLWLLLGVVTFFLGLLAKENVITFLAIIPLTFYFFKRDKLLPYIVSFSAMIVVAASPKVSLIVIIAGMLGLSPYSLVASLIVPAAGIFLVYYYGKNKELFHYFVFFSGLVIASGVYLYIRSHYTEAGITADSPEILNNPFAYINGNLGLKYGTILFTFLEYFKLLLFPIYLTHDYYFNQIPYRSFADVAVIFSLLLNLGLLVYAFVGLMKKSIPAYAILFYFITFSVVSNVLFTVGILMNERFVFFSSVGFSLFLAYVLIQLGKRMQLSRAVLMSVFVVIFVLYGARTFARNFDWANNFHLFLTDEKVSSNSAKIQTSCGGDLTKWADKETDTLKRKEMLKEAIDHLNKAVSIYPEHSNAWLLLGNALYKYDKKHLDPVFNAYERAKTIRPDFYDANYNIGCVQVENGLPEKAIVSFKEALKIKPDVFECEYNLAEAFAKVQQFDSALVWYNAALQEEKVPVDAQANIYFHIGKMYGQQMNNLPMAIYNLTKAIELNSRIAVYYEDLATAYGISGNPDKAIEIALKGLEVDANYKPLINSLIISYSIKNDMASVQKYQARLSQLQ